MTSNLTVPVPSEPLPQKSPGSHSPVTFFQAGTKTYKAVISLKTSDIGAQCYTVSVARHQAGGRKWQRVKLGRKVGEIMAVTRVLSRGFELTIYVVVPRILYTQENSLA